MASPAELPLPEHPRPMAPHSGVTPPAEHHARAPSYDAPAASTGASITAVPNNFLQNAVASGLGAPWPLQPSQRLASRDKVLHQLLFLPIIYDNFYGSAVSGLLDIWQAF